MNEERTNTNASRRIARYLERNRIRVVPETALGRSTFHFRRIDSTFTDATDLCDITYCSVNEKAKITVRRSDGVPEIDGFEESVIRPVKDLLNFARGDLYSKVFRPVYNAVKKMKTTY
jgi:hypothetical protein